MNVETILEVLRKVDGKQARVSFRKKDDRVRSEVGLVTLEADHLMVRIDAQNGRWRRVNVDRVTAVAPL